MGKQVSANRMKRNVMVSVAAQVVSLLVGFILNLVVPKFISELDYSLWQAFLLYLGYVGVLHFGLLDGLLLRYAQYDYEELDKERISSQFQVLLVMTGTLCLAGLATALCLRSPAARWIVAYVSLGIVTKNVFTYNSYVLQLTNRIGGYARLIIAQRVSYGMLALLAVLAGWGDFRWFCGIDLFGDLIGSLFCLRLNRGLYLTKVTNRSLYRELCRETSRRKAAGGLDCGRVAAYIDLNYTDSALSLVSTADEFDVGATYLSMMFKQMIGVTFSAYVEKRRIDRAKELLKKTDMNVKSVAEAVGYTSVNSFGRAFKRVVGASPVEYRAGTAPDREVADMPGGT